MLSCPRASFYRQLANRYLTTPPDRSSPPTVPPLPRSRYQRLPSPGLELAANITRRRRTGRSAAPLAPPPTHPPRRRQFGTRDRRPTVRNADRQHDHAEEPRRGPDADDRLRAERGRCEPRAVLRPLGAGHARHLRGRSPSTTACRAGLRWGRAVDCSPLPCNIALRRKHDEGDRS